MRRLEGGRRWTGRMYCFGPGLLVLGLSVALAAQTPNTGTDAVNLTAASANVNESGSPVKIRILRWSSDAERAAFVTALTPPPPAPPGTADGDRGGAAGAGRGGAGRGAAGRGAAGGGAAGAGRGGAGRGGDAAAPPADPVATLTKAIGSAPLVGYIWTNDVTGYAIKYAYRAPLPDGGERIVLATDRRLGAHTPAWKPLAPATVTDYEFTLIEIRLDAKGLGEGKTSLTTKVILDNEARTVALENYSATPAIVQNVKR